VFAFVLTPALIPPPNFGYVEPDLYRCAVPGEMNFSFLRTLHLKSVVYLSLDPPAQILAEFLREEEIELRQMTGGEKTNIGQRISEQMILGSLRVLLDPDAYPLAVMCNLGRHRTGTVIGCLRRLQRWSLSSIFEEFRRFAGSNSSPMHEQFIELFDTDLVELPRDIGRLSFTLGVVDRSTPTGLH
jgi:tyrosine-protein phosphatase OCA1